MHFKRSEQAKILLLFRSGLISLLILQLRLKNSYVRGNIQDLAQLKAIGDCKGS